MRSLFFLAVFPFLAIAALGADQSLAAARRAQATLGPDLWSEVIHVDNSARTSPYPRSLHALIFELDEILWFYTASDGTQSFSLHRGRLAEEKADLGPLLRAIDPGFTEWQVVADDAPRMKRRHEALPNGCFIESVAAARALGAKAERPQLLAYYVDTPLGRHGHTVLTYQAKDQQTIVDADRDGLSLAFPGDLARDPLALARAYGGAAVVTARLLPLILPGLPQAGLAAAGGESAESPSLPRGIVAVH